MPTFSSVGVYWDPSGSGSGTAAAVEYRPLGTTSWQRGNVLWFDGKALGGRPAEYRGSIVGLAADTTYEVRLKLTGTSASTTQQVHTWSETHPVGTVVELPAHSTKPVDLQHIGSPTGYVLVTGPGGGPANIDVQGAHDYGVRLTNSAYVIIRGLTITGARHHGIQLGASTSDDVHDIVEGNTVSGWGVVDASASAPRWTPRCTPHQQAHPGGHPGQPHRPPEHHRQQLERVAQRQQAPGRAAGHHAAPRHRQQRDPSQRHRR